MHCKLGQKFEKPVLPSAFYFSIRIRAALFMLFVCNGEDLHSKGPLSLVIKRILK